MFRWAAGFDAEGNHLPPEETCEPQQKVFGISGLGFRVWGLRFRVQKTPKSSYALRLRMLGRSLASLPPFDEPGGCSLSSYEP